MGRWRRLGPAIVAGAALTASLSAVTPTQAAACATNPCSGTIQIASPVCAYPVPDVAYCPLNPAVPSPFVATVAIPSPYGNGGRSVKLTGSIPNQIGTTINGEPVGGGKGRLALNFGKAPYVTTNAGTTYYWPVGGSSVTAAIPAGSTSIRISPYLYNGLALNISWTLSFT